MTAKFQGTGAAFQSPYRQELVHLAFFVHLAVLENYDLQKPET